MAQQDDTARVIAIRIMAAPAEQRDSLLQSACGNDASLRAIVESTLLDLETEGANLRHQDTVLTPTPQTIKQANLPSSIGQFSVRRLIGTGGMGAVYEAMQDNPRRKVAVKVMKRGITSASALRRFHLEAQLLGRLHHIGIAQIYEAGTWDDGTGGVPFFAMEYIAGAKELIQYANEKGLDTKQKLELFAQICDAVHHGHQKGIIHRDLKPGNVLVDRNGKVKVIDFGVARSTDSDLAVTTQQTDVGALIGTLQYMSPEQCEADPDIIDTRSDVYALGVMLYELLSGKSPYDLGTMAIYDAVKVVREQPPTKLSVVSPLLRGDLETIVSKALAKDPDYRYQSAVELKLDLERYGRGDPISARPLSLTYQVSLLMRRNKPAVVAIGVIAAVLVVATALSIVLAVRASSAETRALQAQAQTEAQLEKARVGQAFQRDILAMSSPRNAQGRTLTTQQILIEAAAGIDDRFEGLPELAAETRLMVGELMFELQLFDEADRQLNNAIAAIKARQGKDDPRVIQAMAIQGRLWTELGRAKEADQVTADALTRAEHVLAEDDPVRIEAQRARVLALEFLARHADALTLSEEWFQAATRRYGDRHEMTLEAQCMCGRLSMQVAVMMTDEEEQGRLLQGAANRVHAAAADSADVLGPRHPVTLQARTIADFMAWMSFGDDAEARERDLTQSTAALQAVLGQDHTIALQVLHGHGRFLLISGLQRGNTDWITRGEALLEQAQAGYMRRVGPDHPLTVSVGIDLVQARVHREEGESVIAQLRSSYERLMQIHTDDHFEVLRARVLLAVELVKAGQLAEGEPLMRTSIDRISALAGPTHSEALGLCLLLATALIEDGQVDQGLAEGDAVRGRVAEAFDAGEDTAINVWFALGDLYRDAERPNQALAMYEEAAQAAIKHLEPTSSTRANVLAGCANALLKQRQFGTALEMVDVATAGYAQGGDADPYLLQLLDLFRIRALLGLDRNADAEATFAAALEAAGDPKARLLLVRRFAGGEYEAVMEVLGERMLAAALSAREAFEPEDNDDLVWRDVVIGRVHKARGNLAEAVRWQEQAVAAADADNLDDAQSRLDTYRAAIAASDDPASDP